MGKTTEKAAARSVVDGRNVPLSVLRQHHVPIVGKETWGHMMKTGREALQTELSFKKHMHRFVTVDALAQAGMINRQSPGQQALCLWANASTIHSE